MTPIITHEDELDLAKTEKELSNNIKKVADLQRTVANSQRKLAESITELNIGREILNRTLRDVLKQMQTLARESKSNIKDQDVKIFQDLVHKYDQYIEGTNQYVNAIKDLTLKKQDLANREYLFANALSEMAGKRSGLIKKALNVEKTKNKMIEGSKLTMIENELTDLQRDFDRAKDLLFKEIDQFLQIRSELDDLWLKLKDSTVELS
jgi:hypothetical protein